MEKFFFRGKIFDILVVYSNLEGRLSVQEIRCFVESGKQLERFQVLCDQCDLFIVMYEQLVKIDEFLSINEKESRGFRNVGYECIS